MTILFGAIRMAGLVVAIFVMASFGRGVAVADESVFRIADVLVDATAKNATAAREFALGEGHSLAFQRLIDRIVRAADTPAVPRLSHAEVAPMVRSFEVDNEKTSSVRYLARLTFQFDRNAVRRFLRAIGVPFAETRGVQTLVLPVFRSAGTYLLWDEPNLWRDAWANLPETGELVPLLTPLGDLQDVQDIGAAQAAGGNPTRLQAIAGRYRAAEVVVAVAALSRGADGRTVVQVALSRYGEKVDEQTLIQSYQATATETVDQLIQTAAYRTSRSIQDAWKARHLLRFDQENQLEALVPIAGLAEWVQISRALAEIPSIEQSQILSLSRREARIRLRYFGDQYQLAGALVRMDLRLSQEDEAWVLRLASKGAAPNSPGTANPGTEIPQAQQLLEAPPARGGLAAPQAQGPLAAPQE